MIYIVVAWTLIKLAIYVGLIVGFWWLFALLWKLYDHKWAPVLFWFVLVLIIVEDGGLGSGMSY